MEILENMLEFNPYYRKKPCELLDMDIFADLRAEYPEFLVAPPNPIQLEVDKKQAFDYKASTFKKLDEVKLKEQILKEVELIQD